MENTFNQNDESVIELQNVLRQTKQRKRGPNLTEQNRLDIYQAYREKANLYEVAATYGVTLQTIKKAIREKEEQRTEIVLEAPFVVQLASPHEEQEEEALFESELEPEPELESDTKPEPELEPDAEPEVANVETQPKEVEFVEFPVEITENSADERGIADELEDNSEKDIEIEALLVHYIFSLYDANVLSPFEAATFIRRL